jgi:Methyltransferase TRM13
MISAGLLRMAASCGGSASPEVLGLVVQRCRHSSTCAMKAMVPASLQACSAPIEPQELVPPGAPLQQENTDVPFSIKHARQQVCARAHAYAHPSTSDLAITGMVCAHCGRLRIGSVGAPARTARSPPCGAERWLHVPMQASIVGHMRRRGLLDGAAGTAYLEFGAGAGYLSNMLVACCDARTLVLIDSGSFRLKADRCGTVAAEDSTQQLRPHAQRWTTQLCPL